jgi:hypothetical protein
MDLLTRQDDADVKNRFNIALLTQRLTMAAQWIDEQVGELLQIGIFGKQNRRGCFPGGTSRSGST